MRTEEFYPDMLLNPVRIGARRTKWCAACGVLYEVGYFYRIKGMMKGCGKYFSKGALGKSTV